MAAFAPRFTPPHTVQYRDAQVHCAILPNGGLSSLQALNMLECLDLPAEDTPDYWHLLAETMKLVWRDRLHYIADPDFAEVPVARLLSKDYAAGPHRDHPSFPALRRSADPRTRAGTAERHAARFPPPMPTATWRR